MGITIIHPSRGRAYKAAETWRKWNPSNNVQWILSIDEDDTAAYIYFALFGSAVKIISNKNSSAVDAINNAAKIATGDRIMVVSDDTEPANGWETKLNNITGTDWILKTQDGIQKWILTNPCLHIDYYNRFGYIYHPDYKHMFCDTELTCVADLTGRKITSNILFKHNHYSVTKEPPDATSKRADATWDEGERLFLERYKRNFDLPPDQIKGKIQDNGMINWLRRKVR